MTQYSLLSPLGYQQLTTALSAATALTVPAGTKQAFIRVYAASGTLGVRYRDDGTAPTTSVGMPLLSIDEPLCYQGDVSALKFIAISGSPELDVLFYGT